MLMFGMSFPPVSFSHLSAFCLPSLEMKLGLETEDRKRESDITEMLIYRYFAAKAFEKTTGDMSEPMGEFFFRSRVSGQIVDG